MAQEQKGIRAGKTVAYKKYATPIMDGDRTATLYVREDVFVFESGTGKKVIVEGQSTERPLFGVEKDQLLSSLETHKADLVAKHAQEIAEVQAQIDEVSALV